MPQGPAEEGNSTSGMSCGSHAYGRAEGVNSEAEMPEGNNAAPTTHPCDGTTQLGGDTFVCAACQQRYHIDENFTCHGCGYLVCQPCSANLGFGERFCANCEECYGDHRETFTCPLCDEENPMEDAYTCPRCRSVTCKACHSTNPYSNRYCTICCTQEIHEWELQQEREMYTADEPIRASRPHLSPSSAFRRCDRCENTFPAEEVDYCPPCNATKCIDCFMYDALHGDCPRCTTLGRPARNSKDTIQRHSGLRSQTVVASILTR